jgi:hypothetical protein
MLGLTLRWAPGLRAKIHQGSGSLEGLVMEPQDFGVEGIAAEDRGYHGSRFCEVRDAIFANPYQTVWGQEGTPPLPHYKVKESNLLRGILPFGQPYLFGQACARTVDSHADLRWGPDRQGFRRIIHQTAYASPDCGKSLKKLHIPAILGKEAEA